MKAVILAAGEGSRMMPLTAKTPKVLLPVFGVPVIVRTIETLRNAGITEIAINLHHQGDVIRNTLNDGSEYGIHITWSKEEKILGTSGALNPLKIFLDETFIVIYGDNLININLQGLFEKHRRSGSLCTIALTRGLDPANCGVVETGADGIISRFIEKPAPDETDSELVNAGIYVLEPEMLTLIPEDIPSDFARDIFPALIRTGRNPYGMLIDGYLCDIGLPAQWLRAHRDILTGKAGIAVPGKKRYGENIWLLPDCAIHPGAELVEPLHIGRRVCVKAGAVVGDGTVIGEDTVIYENANVKGSVTGESVNIGEHTKIQGAIIARDCFIGKEVVIEPDVIIGESCIIGDGSVILSGARIEPGQKVPENTIIR